MKNKILLGTAILAVLMPWAMLAYGALTLTDPIQAAMCGILAFGAPAALFFFGCVFYLAKLVLDRI